MGVVVSFLLSFLASSLLSVSFQLTKRQDCRPPVIFNPPTQSLHLHHRHLPPLPSPHHRRSVDGNRVFGTLRLFPQRISPRITHLVLNVVVVNFSGPFFASLTHLAIFDDEKESLTAMRHAFVHLPNLTHIALAPDLTAHNGCVDTLALIAGMLAASASLRMIWLILATPQDLVCANESVTHIVDVRFVCAGEFDSEEDLRQCGKLGWRFGIRYLDLQIAAGRRGKSLCQFSARSTHTDIALKSCRARLPRAASAVDIDITISNWRGCKGWAAYISGELCRIMESGSTSLDTSSYLMIMWPV